MAISWGSWNGGNNNSDFRVGVEHAISAVSSGSSSVTMTTKWYVGCEANVNDLMTLTFSGSISGNTGNVNLTTGTSGGYKLFATKTYTYTYSTYGSSPGTRTFTAALSGVYNGATPSKSVTLTIPARPNAVPAAPSAVTATRNSDTQGTIAWTRNATTPAPYASVTVQRRKWEGGGGWSAWSTIATTSSTATSFVDTGVDPNSARQYQVRSNNAAGSSSYVAAGTTLKLTPAAPAAVVAAIEPTGAAIAIAWKNNHYTGQGNLIGIQRSVAGGGYATVATGLAETVTTWTDNSPGAGTNTYQVHVVTNGVPVLTSAVGTSNTVSTTVPPLAPTNLSPDGVAVDFTQAQALTWQHNPGGDQAAQSSFNLQTSDNGGASWTTRASGVTSGVSSWTMPANTLANGGSFLWKVQTSGIAAAGYGPYSTGATLTGSATPATTVTGPTTTITALPATATWTYSQANGSVQNAWELELLEGSQVRETANGTTALSRVLTHPFQQGGTYTLRVRTRSTAGIWSAWATRTLTITLAPPAHVTTTADYQAATGTTVLSLVASAPGGGEVAATSATVERRVPGGQWVTLVTGVALPNDVLDLLPATHGVNEYRVTAKSDTPTYRVEPVVEVAGANPLTADDRHTRLWVFVNYGDSFTTLLRSRSRPEVSSAVGREKAAQQFLGRTKPTPAFGTARPRSLAVKADLHHDVTGGLEDEFLWDSPPRDWEDAGLAAEVVCVRDHTGRRMFGILSDVSTDDRAIGLGSVSFSVEETDYTEAYG